MVRKIRLTEYLKGYDAMSDGERKDYLKRVGEWLAGDGKRLAAATDRPMAKAQNIMLLSSRWSKDDCMAFYEGTLLLSALAGVADTWLPTQLYAKSAYRAVRQMVMLLSNPDVRQGGHGDRHLGAGASPHDHLKVPTPQGGGAASHYNHEPKRAAGAGAELPQALPGGRGDRHLGAGASPQDHQSSPKDHQASPQDHQASPEDQSGLVPVRPRHIDQYVHLLPQKTQERASQVKGLLRDLDDAREKARLLMEAGEHPDKLELWARKATRLDNAVKSIYRELDSEWAKIVKQGRVWVDDLGNAHVKPLPQPLPKGEGEDCATEAAGAAAQELTSEQKHRRRELRKFLTDTRRGNGDTREEHVIKWKENFKEYLTLEPKEKALDDQKIIEAMKHYNISLSPALPKREGRINSLSL